MKKRLVIVFAFILSVTLFYGCAGLETRRAPQPVQIGSFGYRQFR
ncbi:MAG: hypothetical protein P8175_03920 [Deltaproteobacteria bacterium]